MKKLILTISSGYTYDKISQVTHPTIQAYAKRVGADFLSADPQIHPGLSAHFKKFTAIEKALLDYDRVLYVDSDILISKDTPDLFEIVPEDSLGILNEGLVQPREGLLDNLAKTYGLKRRKPSSAYYNTGVMMIPALRSYMFRPWDQGLVVRVDNFFEQTFLNYRIQESYSNIPIFEIDPKFNWMSCFWKDDAPRASGHFIHYAGMVNAVPLQDLLLIMTEDREFVDQEYKKPPRKFALKIDGGLGDQIAANPTVRYLINELYKDDDVVIVSHFPEIWEQHRVPVYETEKVLIPDAKERRVLWSLPPSGHETWNVMSHALVNAYDYAAIAMTRGELPEGKKGIEFHPKYEKANDPELRQSLFEKTCIQDWSRIVLVHPGRGWASKTFPADVWEEYVQTLIDMKWTPVLIGKNSGDQGTVDFKIPEGVINTIDKLSIQELIQIIALAPALLSNDSSPIHIAGAFDNHIGLIATCKRPEYVLPYRRIGNNFNFLDWSRWHRVQALEDSSLALYDKFSRDPFLTGAVVLHQCKESDLREGLPPAGMIADWIEDVEKDMPTRFGLYSNQ